MNIRMNKEAFEARLTALANQANNPVIPCTKLPLDNLVLPEDPALMRIMYAFMPKTAENPNGCRYDPKKYRSVLRVIDGHLLFADPRRESDGGVRTDNYGWPISKVEGYVSKGKARVIDKTAEGMVNREAFLQTIISDEERQMMAEVFDYLNAPFLVIHEAESKRFCIRVTQELLDAGWTHCVCDYEETDANGDAEATELFVGDIIVVTRVSDNLVTGYRVDKGTVDATYSF